MLVALLIFEAVSAFTLSDVTQPWSEWDSFLLAVMLGGIVILGSKADSLLFRQAGAFLSQADAQISRDDIATHGRPNLPVATMGAALWLTFLVLTW